MIPVRETPPDIEPGRSDLTIRLGARTRESQLEWDSVALRTRSLQCHGAHAAGGTSFTGIRSAFTTELNDVTAGGLNEYAADFLTKTCSSPR